MLDRHKAESSRLLPRAWGADTLSEFVDGAFANVLATFTTRRNTMSGWPRSTAALSRFASNLLNPNPLVQAFLLLRSHAAFRSACRLALSGQAAETFVVIRSCLEHALYALHIHKDPALAEVWLGRHDGNDERSRKARFSTRRLWRR